MPLIREIDHFSLSYRALEWLLHAGTSFITTCIDSCLSTDRTRRPMQRSTSFPSPVKLIMDFLVSVQILLPPLFQCRVRILHPVPTRVVQIVFGSVLRRVQHPVLPAMDGLAEPWAVQVPLHARTDVSDAE